MNAPRTDAAEGGLRPLNGVRIVDFSSNIAGPFATMILAQLGADVIKVESPEGDDSRFWSVHAGVSLVHRYVNAGKRGVVLDLKTAEGLTTARQLCSSANVVLQSMRPGVAERLGIDAEALLKLNPDLLCYDLSGYGSGEEGQRLPGYDPLVQAYCAVMTLTGGPDDPPTFCAPPINDKATGMWAAIGALAALQDRQRTGKGHVLDASLFESGVSWVESQVNAYVNAGLTPQRTGAASPNLIPYQTFATQTEDICIAAGNDRLFVKFATAAGRAEWAADPRFASGPQRAEHRAALLPLIAARLKERPCAEWIAALEAVGVPCSVVNDVAGLAASPQLAAVDLMRDMPGENLRMVGLPLEIDAERPQNRRRAPKLGEHTEEVLAGLRPVAE